MCLTNTPLIVVSWRSMYSCDTQFSLGCASVAQVSTSGMPPSLLRLCFERCILMFPLGCAGLDQFAATGVLSDLQCPLQCDDRFCCCLLIRPSSSPLPFIVWLFFHLGEHSVEMWITLLPRFSLLICDWLPRKLPQMLPGLQNSLRYVHKWSLLIRSPPIECWVSFLTLENALSRGEYF